jgi:uncharacterized protein (TIGR03000 family)
LAALLAAGLFLFAGQAQAQRFFGRGIGLGLGIGSPYYGGYGLGASPWYGGYGWNNAYNYGLGNTYSPWGSRYYSGAYNTYYPSNWNYSWNYPSGTYYGGTTSGNYYGTAPTYDTSGLNAAYDNGINMQRGYTSFYSNDQRQRERIPETAALINMRLHPDAKVWFFGDETKSQGSMRQYVTPSLDTGKVFFYEIRARWNENGRDVDRTHRVLVHAGDQINVDFMRDMTNVDEMTPEHLRQRENVRPAESTTPRSERRFYEEDRNSERVNPPSDNTTRPRNDTGTTPANPGGTSGSQKPPQ